MSGFVGTVFCLISLASAQSKPLDEWEKRTADYPLGIELRLVAEDIGDDDYRRVLATMIPTDLAAEWLRVASPDNFVTFVTAHGGREQVDADPKLKSAADIRKEIAEQFLDLQRQAYANRKVMPPFDEKSVEELCRVADQKPAEPSNQQLMPIRVLMPAAGAERQWPQFRGPTGMGVAQTADFPKTWSPTEHIVWKTSIDGSGNSSPILWDDLLFITVAAEEGNRRAIVCYDRLNGERKWESAAPTTVDTEALYWKNSFASCTPVTDGERVFAFFGNAGLIAVDFSGNRLWHCDLGKFTIVHGPGSAPVLYQNLVILIQDQTGSDSVFVAVDKETGEIAWRQKRDRHPCWSTPMLVRAGDRDELLFNGSQTVMSYDPATGDELWRVDGSSLESVPNLLIGGGLIYSASGRNGPYLAIRPGGSGNITKSHVAWRTKQGGAHVPSPVYYNGRLFAVNDVGIAACLDGKTGSTVWQQRLAGRFTSSPLISGDTILATNEEGKTYLFRAAGEFELLGENELAETVYASPALLDGKLYFRTAENVICIAE